MAVLSGLTNPLAAIGGTATSFGEVFFIPTKRVVIMGYKVVQYVLEHVHISETSAKFVLTIFAQHADDKTLESFPGNKRLANMTGLSEPSIKRIVRKLKDDGWLEMVESGVGRGNKRTVRLARKGITHDTFCGMIEEGKGVTDDTFCDVKGITGDLKGITGDLKGITGDTHNIYNNRSNNNNNIYDSEIHKVFVECFKGRRMSRAQLKKAEDIFSNTSLDDLRRIFTVGFKEEWNPYGDYWWRDMVEYPERWIELEHKHKGSNGSAGTTSGSSRRKPKPYQQNHKRDNGARQQLGEAATSADFGSEADAAAFYE